MGYFVITESEFENAREQADEIWSDYDVFEEERRPVDLHQLVKQVVEGQYTHPQGADTLYGMSGSAQSLVSDLVHSSSGDIVPTALPDDVLNRFSQELSEEVQEYSEKVYKRVREVIDPEDDIDLSEVQSTIDTYTEDLVPANF